MTTNETGKRRTETVSVRLDPRLRYLADLAARTQRRTLSSYIEWALEHSLTSVFVHNRKGEAQTINQAAATLWDVEECDRFIRLASRYPDLLIHYEQVLWKLMREYGAIWRGYYDNEGQWAWGASIENVIYDRLRQYWPLFNAIARGEQTKSALPGWVIPEAGDTPEFLREEKTP
jgi:hypothetical protein